ncbi:MAG TPA: amidase family protein [Dongiaceae bacterium]|nr:amidase family protein [Dongiaceae bacterium]
MLIAFLMLALTGANLVGQPATPGKTSKNHNEWTVQQLQAAMAAGKLTSEELTKEYIQRILDLDQNGPGVNSVIELNPDALNDARHADYLRKHGIVLGPLHGIPVLLKDNVDTGDKMQTSAGSFALVGRPALQDSTVAAKLRNGGAVILGKTNLSEWANFRSFESVSGWSGRGGQTNNPYGIARNPCGSSAGSGAAVSSNFAAVSFGTETDGSIVCPANANGVVGLKPTVGLTSRAGIVPISHTQDTFGPHGRHVADVAVALGVVQSRYYDGRDPATGGVPLGWQGRFTRPTNIPTDYTQFLNPNGLQGARLGLTRIGLSGYTNVPTPQPVQDAYEAAFAALTAAGATVIDLDAAGFTWPNGGSGPGEFLVLCYEFRQDVQKYFATRKGVPVAGGTLVDAIAFNNAHADVEMPYFNQDIWDLCESLAPGPDDPQPAFGGMTYNQALALDHDFGVNGIDAALSQFNLDAVVTATDNPAWATDLIFGDHFVFGSSGLAAPEGYPIIQVPASMVFGAPMGLSFFGTAFSEPTLIKLASGFEAFTHTRAKNLPTFAETVPFDHIKGTTLNPPKNLTVPPASQSQAPAAKNNTPTAPTKEQKKLHHL